MADGADRDPVMNLGHIAAWGALVATLLTASRLRYTKMTRDHIVFVPSDNRVRVVGGGSGILPIAWPSEARLHHEDIALFRSEFGSSLTAALRLGYVYRLGPIGEWIFLSLTTARLCLPRRLDLGPRSGMHQLTSCVWAMTAASILRRWRIPWQWVRRIEGRATSSQLRGASCGAVLLPQHP
jgi:hypothetical protein